MRGRKLPSVMGGSIGSREEIWETSGLPNLMVPRLHQCNGYIKRKLLAWRVQKCIALVGADTVLTSAGPQTKRKFAKLRAYQTPWYRVCTNAMVISKGSYGNEEFKTVLPYSVQIRYLPVRSRKLPCVMGGSIGSREVICETSGLPNLIVPRLHQFNGYIKRKLLAWTVQKCIALVGADTVLTSAGPQTKRKFAKLRAYQTPWYRVSTNAMVI